MESILNEILHNLIPFLRLSGFDRGVGQIEGLPFRNVCHGSDEFAEIAMAGNIRAAPKSLRRHAFCGPIYKPLLFRIMDPSQRGLLIRSVRTSSSEDRGRSVLGGPGRGGRFRISILRSPIRSDAGLHLRVQYNTQHALYENHT